jgi:hypothetical protein
METAGAPVDASNPDGSQPSAADSEAPPPPDLAVQPTVWIGETDTVVTFPATAFDGGDTIMAAPGPNASTPHQKVVLILDAVTDSVTGTITFGDGGPLPPPAADPKQPYPPAPTKAIGLDGATIGEVSIAYWQYAPYPGFSYSLVSSHMVGNLLNLAFVPAEIWRDWCALQDPTVVPHPYVTIDGRNLCDCDTSMCRALSSPIRRLDLTVSGNSMQGQLTQGGDGFELSPATAMRLQRVQ